MSDFDTIIKGGTIIDGTRHREKFVGDIGIKDGLIAEIAADGIDAARADKVIEASGLGGAVPAPATQHGRRALRGRWPLVFYSSPSPRCAATGSSPGCLGSEFGTHVVPKH